MRKTLRTILQVLVIVGLFGLILACVIHVSENNYNARHLKEIQTENGVKQLDSLRSLLNLEAVYGSPGRDSVDIFSTAKERMWDKRGSRPDMRSVKDFGKDCSLWAIWYQRPDGDLIEDYNSNSHYILVVSRYGPIDYFSEGGNYIEDINGTTYYGFQIALRLTD